MIVDIDALLARTRIIPVLTIERAEDAVPLAEALVAGGLPVLEVTLRTEAALAAIEAIARAVPDAAIGAGTILTAGDLERARRAGAGFGVSPGLSLPLAEALEDGFPFLPGAVTPSEIMAARDFGFRTLKYFPAEIWRGRGARGARGRLPGYPILPDRRRARGEPQELPRPAERACRRGHLDRDQGRHRVARLVRHSDQGTPRGAARDGDARGVSAVVRPDVDTAPVGRMLDAQRARLGAGSWPCGAC
jgi:2-dehydro-3-deoxyphosphogluconate aldolase/(4S)-4-hydroxy-2-oxoglutarate aldolase